MKNKKLILATSVATLLSCSPSFAKTQGNYVGLDLLRSNSEFQYQYGDGSAPDEKAKDKSYGFGLNYKYAFNFNNFFIAPGIFAEMNNLQAKGKLGSAKESFEIHNRLGLKADIGYDINDKFAIYGTGGFSSISYDYKYNSSTTIASSSGRESGYFYGAGLAYNINDKFAVNVEYNAQSVDLPSPFTSGGKRDEIEANLSVIKLGASYRF